MSGVTELSVNLRALDQELDWFATILQAQVETYLSADPDPWVLHRHPPPDIGQTPSALGRLVTEWGLGVPERIALALTLAPHLRPQMLDILLLTSSQTGRVLTEFGGMNEGASRGFLPTGQTLAFVLSAGNRDAWADYHHLTDRNHRLMREQMLRLDGDSDRLPQIASPLRLSEAWLHYLLTGEPARPETEHDFPARPIHCAQGWNDLVLDPQTMAQLNEIRLWLTYGQRVLTEYRLADKIKPGYRALFFGPPGTGKTLSACLLGKVTNREVYRVDASMVVSKYIGETEKNLGRVFDVAQYRDWLLFFDEADALFGKRTTASTSNDRHANQQTAYLLQRIEDFPGVVILSTNLRANMDEAFTRRFQSMIQFPMPGPAERLRLWQAAFAGSVDLAPDIDLNELAERAEVAGGAVINVLRAVTLTAAATNSKVISRTNLIDALRRELAKDSKSLQWR
ncbi:AAA family ATPase [Niveispirillum lacus]|uniref:AAA family ATPase n=1 Tax=Niveispirillum lacus TaxID=1981099 RepID=A0A255Z426_9PROT|nr:ATP-binding protein [Niveispirillum lacus]OYQ36206.1 AAA family ATPase [Niveispirillum lacus]